MKSYSHLNKLIAKKTIQNLPSKPHIITLDQKQVLDMPVEKEVTDFIGIILYIYTNETVLNADEDVSITESKEDIKDNNSGLLYFFTDFAF